MSLSLTLIKNKKIERYIKIKIHKIENDVNILCDWIQVSLVFVLSDKTSMVLCNPNTFHFIPLKKMSILINKQFSFEACLSRLFISIFKQKEVHK